MSKIINILLLLEWISFIAFIYTFNFDKIAKGNWISMIAILVFGIPGVILNRIEKKGIIE